jgi:hypothetical protein
VLTAVPDDLADTSSLEESIYGWNGGMEALRGEVDGTSNRASLARGLISL